MLGAPLLYAVGRRKGYGMKRYLIFAALGPLLGGFWLLLTTTILSGYWSETQAAHPIGNLLKVFFTTVQYSYLFGFLPALMIGAIDDILSHVRRIAPLLRVLIVAVIAFFGTGFLYGSRGGDSGAFQFFMYGLVGVIPAVISSWLVHKYIGEPPAAAQEPAPPAPEKTANA
jgi:hypothetical protein